MSKKIIITESQLDLVVQKITETTNKERMIKKVVTFLKDNYEPTKGSYKKGGEYHETAMVINKANDEMISVKSLYQYITYKFSGLSNEFIKQVVTDYLKGNLDDEYKLSKNVSM